MGSILAHNDSHGISQIIVVSVFLALDVVAIVLRLWSRRIKKMPLQLNDYEIMISLVCLSGFGASIIAGDILGGAGKHEDDVSLTNIIALLKIFTSAEPIWALSNTFVKLSILNLYQKIFRGKAFKIACYGVMATTACYLTVVILELFLLCHPFRYNWDKSIDGKCADTNAAFLSAGIINLLIDVMVVLLPLYPLWGLQMATEKKAQLTAIFCLGGLICIISILRIVSIQNLDEADFTYSVSLIGIWSFLEPSLGIVSACLPVMQPVLSKISASSMLTWTKNFGSRNGTSKAQFFNNGGSGSTERIASRPKKFQRLEDASINLTNLEHGTYTSKVGAADDRASKDSLDKINIQVRHEWDVHSDNV